MSAPDRNSSFFERSLRLMPGGVNSPARSWRAVGGVPRFIAKGKGAHVWDVEGKRFVDYVCSWGAMIHGHCPEEVTEAIAEAAACGTSFGAPTEREAVLAELIIDAVPSIEMVRFVNSGTEATMSALRLARAFTGRDKILKFSGGYHGHSDSLLVEAGSGLASHAVVSSAGVPHSFALETLVAPYNNIEAAEHIFEANKGEVAAVIVEPIAGNMGIVRPVEGFLEGLRRLTLEHGALLIFDEVITGFRVGWGGVQGETGIQPDITCLGKIVGGGFPIGAYGGRADVMQKVSPLGDMYQAGTLSGNPVAMAAGIASLNMLKKPGVYDELQSKTDAITEGVASVLSRAEIKFRINSMRGAFTIFFSPGEVTDMDSAAGADMEGFGRFFHKMIEQGIHPPPSGFEAWFVSLAHSDQDIQQTIESVEKCVDF